MTKKILIVDDDESILDAVCLVLEDEGYMVETTLNGDEIFEKVTSYKPNLILLAVLISGKDGRDICRVLKKTEDIKGIPIIMISAHPSAKDGATACGAEAFLAKPFDTQDLIDIVAKYLR